MRIRPVSTVTSALLALSLTTLASLSSVGLAAAPAGATTRPAEPVVIGHRGVPVQAPENTLASIDRAARLGTVWVENDVQRTKDGALVVMHDTTLERTTDVKRLYPRRAPWKVSDFTLAEIRTLDAGSWYDRRFKGERVPTLDRYLRRVDHNRQKLLLEVKAPELYPGIERQIVAELRRAGWLDAAHVRGRLVVQSFNASSLRTLHTLRPDLKKGFLGAPKASELRSYAAFADQINPSYKNVTPAWLRSVHALKGPHGRPLEVSAWTVDDADEAVSLARMGVDGIITNAPHVIADALSDDADDPSFLDGLPDVSDAEKALDSAL
ncbi:glycerophosphodiester phosphodiesterase [Streptomyces griseocarneus]|uniref:glycerophosphodiester phosphodiesterase n=1 Tax=Streptomyces griseocarneus TaxID=51201 RepID=UPI00167D7F0D|nr:glycerophosphodiester phosphodiesterase family protein [Streptomyces griseocarneus]MBZ6471880.1 glycerophosphodiester phosphodiesterase [Streptomyces griseocarneus]GHG71396.1 hydrolase [Streptomyces griseocarneus]